MKIHNFAQGTDEWFKVRLGKLTASDALTIASNGIGLDTLVYKKVAEIITGKVKESYTNEDIERGKELEKMARNSYELESNNTVKEVGFIEESEFIGASPDGFVGDQGLFEAKCKDDANFVKYLYKKEIDKAHEWQMQMQMLVTGREWVDYVVYNENFPKTTITVRVMRDEVMIAKLKAGIQVGIAKIQAVLEAIK
jgi:putative phage-type endonuclease